MQVTIILSTLYLTSIGVDGRSLKGTKILNVFLFFFFPLKGSFVLREGIA